MSNRYWTDNKQRGVVASGHGPAYGRDGGKVLNDTETQPKYNENIGPDGPDLNRVGFPTVKAFVKAKFLIMEGSKPTGWSSMTSEEQAGVVGGIGKALGSIGSSMDTEQSAPQVIEPGKNSGSAPVATEFDSRVRRSGR